MDVKKYKKIQKKDDLVNAYLNDIKGSKSKPISQEEEKNLLEKYYAEDTTEKERVEIRKKIVMSHQRFLYDMAKCYANDDNSLLLELISVGTLGMYDTFDKFDISKKNKFMTYAQYYVRRAIYHFLDDENLIVRPANNTKLSPKVKRIEEEFYRRTGQKPTVFDVEDELFSKYNIELTDKNRNDIYGATIERLENTGAPNGGNNSDASDNFTFEKSKDFNEFASTENDFIVESEKRDTAYELNKLISRLPEREATIIRMSYGFGDYLKPCDNEDIGEVLGLTAERVRQLRKGAEEKLKSMYERIEV